VLWSWLLACAVVADEDDFVPAAAGESSRPRHPDAAYTAEEAAAQMKEAVRFGLPSTADLWSVWTELVSHGDNDCPGSANGEMALEVFDPNGCTAGSGYWYQGVGGGGVGWIDEDGDGSRELYLEALKADGTMRTPDGTSFRFGGDMSLTARGDARYAEVSAELLGTYSYPSSTALWLAEGASSALYMEGTREDNVWKLTLNGGITVTEQAVGFKDYGLNGACGAYPSGAAAVRDNVGYWYELVYDETTCDGCGEVTFDHNQPLGRACVDLSPAILFALTATEVSMATHEQWQ
jgi:hypothetical protein